MSVLNIRSELSEILRRSRKAAKEKQMQNKIIIEEIKQELKDHIQLSDSKLHFISNLLSKANKTAEESDLCIHLPEEIKKQVRLFKEMGTCKSIPEIPGIPVCSIEEQKFFDRQEDIGQIGMDIDSRGDISIPSIGPYRVLKR